MRLLPREEKFFALFTKQVKIIEEAAKLLYDGVKSGNSHIAAAASQIQELEHKGDEIIHDIFKRLNQTFITPLDPEDIHSLSSHLDDVLDGIEDAAHRIVSYRLEPIPPVVLKLAGIVYDMAKALSKAIEAMNTSKLILEHCIEINRLEDEADGVVRQAISDLFSNVTDPILLIKQKEIIEFLEYTTDRCEDVADVLQNVAVKNS